MPQPLISYPGQPERKRSRVAIIGYTDHRLLAPFSDTDWDIWFLNDLHHELPKVAPMDRLRVFQVHSWHDGEAWAPERAVNHHPLDGVSGPVHQRDHGYIAMLADWATKIPVYLFEKRQEVPEAITLPKDELFELFTLDGITPNKYFTNSVSWQIGLAIAEGYEEIGVYGVDMMMGGGEGSEYGYQRPSCEFFMGVAQGRGIRVFLPQESDLMKTLYVYGDRNEAPFRKNIRRMMKEYRGRIANFSNQISQCQTGIQQLTGAINTLEWIERGHLPGDTGDKIGMLPEPNAQNIPALQPAKKEEAAPPTQDQIVSALGNIENYMAPRVAMLDKVLSERFPNGPADLEQASDSAGPSHTATISTDLPVDEDLARTLGRELSRRTRGSTDALPSTEIAHARTVDV